jgi:hypothetical protein
MKYVLVFAAFLFTTIAFAQTCPDTHYACGTQSCCPR